MDPQFVQNLRYKLQRRVRRLRGLGWEVLPPGLTQFWAFFDAVPLFAGIASQLTALEPAARETADRIVREKKGILGDTETEMAAIAYWVLRSLVGADAGAMLEIARAYAHSAGLGESCDFVKETFLDPFYDYVDEQLDDQRAALALLLRYKHRSEWFKAAQLREIAAGGERALASDLYCYLHDQGLDFYIEPRSLKGAADLVASQAGDHRFVADAKIFDDEGRGKSYVCSGFHQVYTYTQQFNEAFGYLIIFKLSETDLRWSLQVASPDIPVVIHNNKTIFLMVIDIADYGEPVSKRGALRAVEITAEDLVRPVGGVADGSAASG